MPRHTPFHRRTRELYKGFACEEWAGYVAASNYDRDSVRGIHAANGDGQPARIG